MLENAACPFKMYRHDASQVSTNKRDLAIFWRDRQYFCLQKAGWLVNTSVAYCTPVGPPLRVIEKGATSKPYNV